MAELIRLGEYNYIDNKVQIKIPYLSRSRNQLTDLKKERFGYNSTDSVIDVGEGQYGVSFDGSDYLYTCGIEPCCGVVLSDGVKSILFHLDGSSSPIEVKKVTDSFEFGAYSKVLICPGVTCGIPGSFKYQELAELYKNMGYEVEISRIDGPFGYVEVAGTQVKVGSILTDNIDVYDLKQKGFNK